MKRNTCCVNKECVVINTAVVLLLKTKFSSLIMSRNVLVIYTQRNVHLLQLHRIFKTLENSVGRFELYVQEGAVSIANMASRGVPRVCHLLRCKSFPSAVRCF